MKNKMEENAIEGFGFWKLEDEKGYMGDYWGVIDRDRMLFMETDKERQLTGKTYNLLKLKSWERVKEPTEIW